MPLVAEDVLGSIGNTPLVELRKVVPAGCGRVFAKLEWANPTGSMKDRMAAAAIRNAEADGRLQPGGTVVEYTAGTTGISLALVCAARGYGLEIVFSDAFSDEKRRTMQAFGARITDVPSDNQQITEALIKAMIDTAAEISRRPGHWYCDQLNNHDAIQGYLPLGEEIWRQTGGRGRRFRARRQHCALDPWRDAGAVAARPESPGDRGRTGRVRRAVGRALGIAQDRGHRHRLHSAAVAPGPGQRNPAGRHAGSEGNDAGDWRARKASSAESPRGPTWWRRSASRAAWVRVPTWSRSSATRGCAT